MEPKKLSKKERRLIRQNQTDQNNKLNFKLKHIEPLTQNQKLVYNAFDQGKNLMLHGIAGTGKSFISMYLSLKELLRENSTYKKLYIIRSVVPTRDMGFLPGNSKEKSKVFLFFDTILMGYTLNQTSGINSTVEI